MAIEYLDQTEYWKAIISWMPPRKWYKDENDPGVYLDKKIKNYCGVYRFERKHGNEKNGNENLYIGIAYKQSFNVRLHQGYHDLIVKKAKTGEIWVSVGIVDLQGSNHTKERYEEIESILIYFSKPTLNEKKKKWGPDCGFEIVNEKYRGSLPKYIKYPVAEIVY